MSGGNVVSLAIAAVIVLIAYEAFANKAKPAQQPPASKGLSFSFSALGG